MNHLALSVSPHFGFLTAGSTFDIQEWDPGETKQWGVINALIRRKMIPNWRLLFTPRCVPIKVSLVEPTFSKHSFSAASHEVKMSISLRANNKIWAACPASDYLPAMSDWHKVICKGESKADIDQTKTVFYLTFENTPLSAVTVAAVSIVYPMRRLNSCYVDQLEKGVFL